MNFICRPTYVNFANFVFVFVSTSFCVCVSILQVIFLIFTSNLLLCNIRFIVSCSFLLFFPFIGYVEMYLIAASFCSYGWQVSLGIIMSVAVDFVYVLNEIL